MDQPQKDATLSTRRSAKHRPPIQTSLVGPTARQQSKGAHSTPLAPRQDVSPALLTTPTPSLRSKSSKISLFGLFSRPQIEKQRAYHSESGLPSLLPTPAKSPERPSARRSSKSAPTMRTDSSAQQSPRSSTLLHSQHTPGRNPQKSRRTSEVPRGTDSMTAAWTPPPLFQAYPQAVIHTSLEASTISANSIMRARKHQRQYSLIQERMETKLDLPDASRMGHKATKKGMDQSEHERRMSVASAPVLEFTKKTYVLVTSGYLLQYAGDGPSDRVPEKCLQLGEDSAAFACDLIEGKHYVLQVCQRIDGEGKIANSKSILSKLRLPSSTAPRSTSSILMIFESPKELDLWMTLIRREIDACGGGRTYRAGSDTSDEDEVRADEESVGQPASHRYQVRRDPNRFSSQSSPPNSGLSSPRRLASGSETPILMKLDAASDVTSLRSSQHHDSMTSLSAVSNVDHHLAGLRKSVHQRSYVSIGSRKSAGCSPVRGPSIDDFPLPGQAISTPYEPSPYVMSTQDSANKRRSSQDLSPSQEVTGTSEPYQSLQRHHSYDTGGQPSYLLEPAAAPLVSVIRSLPSAGSLPSGSGQLVRRYGSSSSRNAPSIPPTIIDEVVADERCPSAGGNRQSPSSLGPRSSPQPSPRVAVRSGQRPFHLPIRVSSPTSPRLVTISAEFAQSPTTAQPSPPSQSANLAPALPEKSLRRPASMQMRETQVLSSTTGNTHLRSSSGDYPSKVPSSPRAAKATQAAKYSLQGHYSRVPAYALPPLSGAPPDTPLPLPPIPVSPASLTA